MFKSPALLKQRVITGSLLALSAVLAIVFLPPQALVIVLAMVTLLGCWEWADLAGIARPVARLLYCVLSACTMVALLDVTQLLNTVNIPALQLVLIVAALWWCLAWFGIKTFPGSAAWWGSTGARLLMGWLALLPAWLALAYLRFQPGGEWKVLFLLAFVAAADVGAYFSGTQFGKRKLASAVSPGKSWEGFWGGLTASILFTALLWRVLWVQFPLSAMLLIAAIAVVASVLGDLLESMLKRYRGVKDSSNILPGHGGVLDRLDSISAAAPIFVLGLLFIL